MTTTEQDYCVEAQEITLGNWKARIITSNRGNPKTLKERKGFVTQEAAEQWGYVTAMLLRENAPKQPNPHPTPYKLNSQTLVNHPFFSTENDNLFYQEFRRRITKITSAVRHQAPLLESLGIGDIGSIQVEEWIEKAKAGELDTIWRSLRPTKNGRHPKTRPKHTELRPRNIAQKNKNRAAV